jgi:hypothetical protein
VLPVLPVLPVDLIRALARKETKCKQAFNQRTGNQSANVIYRYIPQHPYSGGELLSNQDQPHSFMYFQVMLSIKKKQKRMKEEKLCPLNRLMSYKLVQLAGWPLIIVTVS